MSEQIIKNGEWITDWDFFKQIECAKDLALNCNYEKAIALYDAAETKLLQNASSPIDAPNIWQQAWFGRRNKSQWLADAGQLDEALEVAMETSQEAIAAWGSLDERVLLLRNCAIYWLLEAGQFALAWEQGRALLQDAQAVLAPEHHLHAVLENNVGRAALLSGESELGERMLTNLLDKYLLAGTENDLPAILTRGNLVSFLEKEKRWDEAADLYHQQARAWRTHGESEREAALWMETNESFCLLLMGEREKAANQWERILSETLYFFGEMHPLVSEILGIHVTMALAEGEHGQTLKHVNRLIEIAKQAGDKHNLYILQKIANYCQEKTRSNERTKGRSPGNTNETSERNDYFT